MSSQPDPQTLAAFLEETSSTLERLREAVGAERRDSARALLQRMRDAAAGFAATLTEAPEELPPEWRFDAEESRRIPAELAAVFKEEAAEHLATMETALRQLQAEPGRRSALQELRRSAHTLKGAAGAVGLKAVTGLSHQLENLLDQLTEQNQPVTPEHLELMQLATDLLHELAQGGLSQETLRCRLTELAPRYRRLLRSVTSAEPAEVVAPAVSESETVESAPSSAGPTLRVPLSRVESLSGLVSEQIINRSACEQRRLDLDRYAEELRLAVERLGLISRRLEREYGADRLGGSRPDQPRGEWLSEFDALEFDRYTEFHLQLSSLAESASDLGSIGQEVRNVSGDFETLLHLQSRLSRDVQDRLTRIRMLPVSTLASRLQRTVRSVAQPLRKQVRLQLDGAGVELDKALLEDVADALIHLLRNAVDHGIESPEIRRALGKPEVGTIRLSASYEGTQAVLRIADDGAGLNEARIRQKALERGLIAPDAELTAAQLYPLIFEPGFSTAATVSEISGRGVGMDVVRDKALRLNGAVSVASTPGEGTTFTIRLPLTLSLMQAVLVKAGGETFAVPMQSLVEVQRVERDQLLDGEHGLTLRLREQEYPCRTLAGLLQLSEPAELPRWLPTLILRSGEQTVAVVVEELVGGREIVVKTLGSHLRHVTGVVGVTQFGDGSLAPILNLQELLETPPPLSSEPPAFGDVPETPVVMIVDDSVSVRKVTANLLRQAGWETLAARDGVEALEVLNSSERSPHLFLLDIEMPRMDGYELLSLLRKHPRHAEAPVVIVTSRAREKYRDKALQLGATDFLAKPYQEAALLGLIRRLLAVPTASN